METINFYIVMSIMLYHVTSIINVCIHELGHGIAGSLLGCTFQIEVGKGKKLFQITDRFVFYQKLFPAPPWGYCHNFQDDCSNKYRVLSYKSKIFISAGGILAQLITMAVIGALKYFNVGTESIWINGIYSTMLFSSFILLLYVTIPNSKNKNDAYHIIRLYKLGKNGIN